MQTFFCFDVESLGLYGPPFAAGYCIVDATGKELEADHFSVSIQQAIAERDWRNIGFNLKPDDIDWVKANVLPALKEVGDYPNRMKVLDVLSSLWRRWTAAKQQYPGIVMVADCPAPVETNFLRLCLERLGFDMNQSPYPLIDVASCLLAQGLDPVADYGRRDNELPIHHPMADARQSARVLLGGMRPGNA